MNNTISAEATVKETKSTEVDSPKVFLTCANQSTKGVENPCKCGTFLIPLCVVI